MSHSSKIDETYQRQIEEWEDYIRRESIKWAECLTEHKKDEHVANIRYAEKKIADLTYILNSGKPSKEALEMIKKFT